MSLAEDLLNSLPEDQPAVTSADPATEPHIVINADKTITIPEALKRILVQHEHNIETVTFDCPRYWDGHDLSKMGLKIVFQRSDGHKEPHLVENLRVDELDTNTIHFDWTVSGNTTFASGNVKITVCAKLTNAEGVSEREWYTIPNQDLFVNQGMDCSGEEIVERNPDVIEYILAELDELKNATPANPSTPSPDSGQNANGLSDTAKALLITILRNGVYSTDQSANITALENALAGGGSGGEVPDIPDVPDIPEKTLTSISATYSGGDVAVGTAVSALTGVAVTAHYSDGSSAAVTGYTLSGEIAEGENTITVTYQGKTATFTVTGVAESGGGDGNVIDAWTSYEWTEGIHLSGQVGQSIVENENSSYAASEYVSTGNVEKIVVTEENGGALAGYTVFWFDSDKKSIDPLSTGSYIRKDNANYPSPVEIAIPENAAYFRIDTRKEHVDGTSTKFLVKYSVYLK